MKTQPANPQPTPTHHFTNFTEISYGKTRNSYDQCEAPPLTTSVRPALQSVRPERRDGVVRAADQSRTYNPIPKSKDSQPVIPCPPLRPPMA